MTHSKAERIGILTSGGDCPGLNAVIRGTYKAARQLGYEVIGFQRGYEGLVDPVSYVHLTTKVRRASWCKVVRFLDLPTKDDLRLSLVKTRVSRSRSTCSGLCAAHWMT